jgi:2,4-dienoyl-CoA reductase-like NADH-dependent reductase (Old Yellow Enzyme family)
VASTLFSPFEMRGLRLENRITVSPMCQYSAVDGCATDWHLMHLGKFAISGAGLVVIEATHVEARGRITPRCLGLYSDENEAALGRVVAFCREAGRAKIGVQLSHSGRKGSAKLPWEGRGRPLTADEGAWERVSPGDIPFDHDWPAPRPLDRAGLKDVKQAHVDAVLRCVRIGVDLIEFHVAHGYLLHEFLSPLTNNRTDEYGGSLENRLRYPLEVFSAIRAACPDEMPVGVRVSALDYVEGGWTIEETEVFARELKRAGCDYVTVSSGGLSTRQKIPIGEGYQTPFARRIRQAASIPTTAVGMIYRPEHAEEIVRDGHADMIALARTMLFDPHWVWYAAGVLGAEPWYPPQYIRGYRSDWLRGQRCAAGSSAQDA